MMWRCLDGRGGEGGGVREEEGFEYCKTAYLQLRRREE